MIRRALIEAALPNGLAVESTVTLTPAFDPSHPAHSTSSPSIRIRLTVKFEPVWSASPTRISELATAGSAV